MRFRLLAAGAAAVAAGTLTAQPPADLPPPLLPVPGKEAPPAPFAPGGKVGPYDPGYLYLPEPGPEFERPAPAPHGMWKVAASAELAWLSTGSLPGTVRADPRDVFGSTIRGLYIPTDGRGTGAFQPGLGLTVGRWLGESGGVEANAFVLPGLTRRLDGFAPGTLVSFADPAATAPVIIRFPPALSGFTSAFPATLSTTFVGLDLNYRHMLVGTRTARVDALVGYRFAYLSDELYLGEEPLGDSTTYRDNRLQAETTFHGGQFGLAAAFEWEAWYLEGTAKIAYGAVTARTNATGAFAATDPAAHFASRTRDATLPSVGAKLGYRVGDRAGFFASYSFQYLNHVARLGDAFTRDVAGSDLWVQSVGLGLEWRY